MENLLAQIVEPPSNWYISHKRTLPWREKEEPYHVWLSEIMLQQTRVEAVKKYYNRFIEVLPTIDDLARIEEEKLLKLWEGLGYYNRARNLKKAAQIIVEAYAGKMPTTYAQLCQLPGIGEYTAGAIASICFGEKVPAVDGNVLRVVARVTGSFQDVLLPETKKEVSKTLRKIMPDEPGVFNEALMELGEVICLPNTKPLCERCPLQSQCIAYQKDLTQQLPVRIKKQKRIIEEKTVFLLCYENQIAIQKREEKGLLANLYGFPNIEGKIIEEEISKVLENWGIQLETLQQKQNYKHIFTHRQWDMIGYLVTVKNKNIDFLWVERKELEKSYAIPTAFKTFEKMLGDIYEYSK